MNGTLNDMDLYPLTVRGPHQTTTSGVVTFARMFTHGGKLYIAESRDKGRTVATVTEYDLPEGNPTQPGKAAKWGPWVYSSCGCGNSWPNHSINSLLSLVLTPQE